MSVRRRRGEVSPTVTCQLQTPKGLIHRFVQDKRGRQDRQNWKHES